MVFLQPFYNVYSKNTIQDSQTQEQNNDTKEKNILTHPSIIETIIIVAPHLK